MLEGYLTNFWINVEDFDFVWGLTELNFIESQLFCIRSASMSLFLFIEILKQVLNSDKPG